jgi:LacI family transcriptional regulator
MSVTLKDVAERASVSPASASMVLNGKPGISGETRNRVIQAALELNYNFNTTIARRSAKTNAISFLKIAKHGHTINPDHNVFLSDYVDGISQEADALGYKLQLASFDKVSIESIASDIKKESASSGLVILGTELIEDDIRVFKTLNIPFVVMDNYSEYVDCNFVDMNNREAVFKVLIHFVESGFREIGMISSNVQTMNFKLRQTAFQDGLRVLGLEQKAGTILTIDSTYQGAYEDMSALLRQGISLPECFFCANDIITYGCIKAFREHGIRIPQDLSLVGFDNLPMSSKMDPPLTSIDVSKKMIGKMAVTLLDQLMTSKIPPPSVKILVSANLVVRESVLARPNADRRKEAVPNGLLSMT